jgi:hypothetical protein
VTSGTSQADDYVVFKREAIIMNAHEQEADVMEVLLVEDSPGDVRLMQEAFRANQSIHLNVATDGVEAMAFLRREAFTAVLRARISSCWT